MRTYFSSHERSINLPGAHHLPSDWRCLIPLPDEEACDGAVGNEAVRIKRPRGGCPGAGFQEGGEKTGNDVPPHRRTQQGGSGVRHVGVGRQLNGKAATEAGAGGEEQA